MSDREATHLLEQARAFDPVPEGTVDNVASRLASRRRRRTFGWPLAALTAAAAVAAVVALRPAPPPPLPVVEVAAPAKARFVPAPPVPKEAPAVTAPKRRALARAPAPAVEAEATAVAEVPPPPPAFLPIAPEDHRAELAPAPERSATKYQPRAIRELLDVDRIENVEVAAQVRRMMTTMDRRALLAQLDGMRLDEADLLVFRGALRASYDRCADAIADFDRARRLSPASGAQTNAARALCEPTVVEAIDP